METMILPNSPEENMVYNYFFYFDPPNTSDDKILIIGLHRSKWALSIAL